MLCVREIGNNLLGFENLTLCPYDKNLIDVQILNDDDIAYINQYHHRVWQTLSPKVISDESTLNWLR